MLNYETSLPDNSKRLTFSRPGREQIYVDLNGQIGALGLPICQGGKLDGDTIIYKGDDASQFAAICQDWCQAYFSHLMRS